MQCWMEWMSGAPPTTDSPASPRLCATQPHPPRTPRFVNVFATTLKSDPCQSSIILGCSAGVCRALHTSGCMRVGWELCPCRQAISCQVRQRQRLYAYCLSFSHLVSLLLVILLLFPQHTCIWCEQTHAALHWSSPLPHCGRQHHQGARQVCCFISIFVLPCTHPVNRSRRWYPEEAKKAPKKKLAHRSDLTSNTPQTPSIDFSILFIAEPWTTSSRALPSCGSTAQICSSEVCVFGLRAPCIDPIGLLFLLPSCV
jgi:hypothetical protein